MTAQRQPTAGFTLIEVLVALALFALISGAGFAMLDQVLRTQSRTDGRLERLAALQRAMYLVTNDFLQARGQSFTAMPEEGGTAVSLRRNAAGPGEGAVRLTYRLQEGTLMRVVAGISGPPVAEQALVAGVALAEWRFHDPQAGWVTDWPPAGQLPGAAPPNPAAVELRLTLADGALLRRVALLPRDGG